jgi:hypothetical protein
MAQHMNRNMPAHLKKYQQGGGYIPKHAERALSKHIQKNLPGHLKQYADPYIQQHVMWGNNTSSAAPASSLRSSAGSYHPTASSSPVSGQIFSASSQRQNTDAPFVPITSEQNNQQSPLPQEDNDYDFIMNSGSSGNKQALFAPENTKMRILLFAAGIIVLIILILVFFSFLSSAGNKQKENLLAVAKTQQEIVRVIDLNKEHISDRDLNDKIKTLRAVIVTSQQEVTSALTARGTKANPKELAKSQNPKNDTDLESARAQAKGDQVLDEIIVALLGQYAAQLQVVFDNGNESEKALATDSFNQVNTIYNLSQDDETDQQNPPSQ